MKLPHWPIFVALKPSTIRRVGWNEPSNHWVIWRPSQPRRWRWDDFFKRRVDPAWGRGMGQIRGVGQFSVSVLVYDTVQNPIISNHRIMVCPSLWPANLTSLPNLGSRKVWSVTLQSWEGRPWPNCAPQSWLLRAVHQDDAWRRGNI